MIAADARTQKNYDPTNELYAEDLLYLCYELCIKVKEPDFDAVFIDKLNEMNTGMCPQGRTHRLLEVVMTFQEFL